MSARTFAGRSGRSVVLTAAAVLAGVVGAGAAVAVADSGGQGTEIYACVQTNANTGKPVVAPGNVRIIDPSKGQSCYAAASDFDSYPEEEISWNQTGPAGPAGDVVTLANQTFTIAGVKPIATVSTSTPSGLVGDSDGKPVATMSIDGKSFSATGVSILSFSLSPPTPGTHSKLYLFQIVKRVDRYSPGLFKSMMSGDELGKLVIKVPRLGAHGAATITLTGVHLTAYDETKTGGKTGGSFLQLEQVQGESTHKVHVAN